MLLFANKARTAIVTSGITAAAGQVANITAASGAQFVGVGGVPTNTTLPALIRCVVTAVDANGNDTGAYEIVDVHRPAGADTLTFVNRGLEGTAAAAWGVGTVIECRPTARVESFRNGPILLQRGVGRSTQSLASAMSGAPVQPASIMPAGAALSIPAGFLVAGDVIRIEYWCGHRGTAVTTNWTTQVTVNSFFGTTGNQTMANASYYQNQYITIVNPASLQINTGHGGSGGFYGYANGSFTLDLTSVALVLDIMAGFSSAPSGTEAIFLDRYEITLIPAGTP
jgi:hypothetical protein